MGREVSECLEGCAVLAFLDDLIAMSFGMGLGFVEAERVEGGRVLAGILRNRSRDWKDLRRSCRQVARAMRRTVSSSSWVPG